MSLGFIHIGQWVKVKGGGEWRNGWQQENKVRSCLSKSYCPKGGMKKHGKITHNLLSMCMHTHMCTRTPLSFNDAMRAWKGNTVGIVWVWKKHFFLLWQTKSGAMKMTGALLPFLLDLPSSHSFFFLLSLLALLSAVLNVAQVQRAHRPSLLQTIRPSEWGRVLFLSISSQSQLPAKASPTSWPQSGCLPISVSHRALTLPYNISKCISLYYIHANSVDNLCNCRSPCLCMRVLNMYGCERACSFVHLKRKCMHKQALHEHRLTCGL